MTYDKKFSELAEVVTAKLEQHGILMKGQSLAIPEFDGESDRGAALVSMAFIEYRLTEVIRKCFVTNDNVTDKFLRNNQVFTFETKSNLAYAFGVIGPKTLADLKTLGKVRNRFAHHPLFKDAQGEPVLAQFENPVIEGLCKNLYFCDWMNELSGEPKCETARSRFSVTATTIDLFLGFYLRDSQPLP